MVNYSALQQVQKDTKDFTKVVLTFWVNPKNAIFVFKVIQEISVVLKENLYLKNGNFLSNVINLIAFVENGLNLTDVVKLNKKICVNGTLLEKKNTVINV